MNWVEKRAEDYLRAQRYETVFEPDGQCPPDFVLNGCIAVEVRRLNQIRQGTGLENDLYRLHDTFADVLKSFGSAQSISWWVSFRFGRPAPSTAELKRALREFLHSERASRTTARMMIGNMEVKVQQANIKLENVFALGTINDLDSGGSVTSLLIDSMKHCIEEKTRKITRHRHKYEAWWLWLLNTTPYQLHPDELSVFRSSVTVGNWTRIICVGLRDAYSALVI